MAAKVLADQISDLNPRTQMCFGRLLARTGEDHLLESKKPMCLRPENEIAAVTFFAKNVAAATISNTFASVTEWQDSREHGC